MEIYLTTMVVQVNSGSRLSQSRNCRAMTGGCTRCMAMYGNGARIGLQITRRSRSSIQKGRNLAIPACCAAAHGTSAAGSAGLLDAFPTILLSATPPLVSVLSEVNELKSSQRGGAGQQPVGSRRSDNNGARAGQAGDVACFYAAQVGHSLSPAL